MDAERDRYLTEVEPVLSAAMSGVVMLGYG